MSVLAIACDNCGAKYRLPESFSGDKAKCQKCGSVIDVAAQRKAAAAPAAPTKPAAAKPAAEQPQKTTSRAAAKADAPAPRASRAAKSDAEKAEAKPARGRKEAGEPKKNSTMLLAGGGIAALAIVAVIVVLASGGKEKPMATEAAKATQPAPAAKAAEAPKAVEASAAAIVPAAVEASAPKDKPAAAEVAAQDKKPAAQQPAQQKPAEQKPAEPKAEAKAAGTAPAATTEPKADATKPADAEAKGGSEIKERWEANKTTSLADVYKPSVLGDVSWPTECEQAQKDEIVSLIEDVCGGGKAGIAAKPKLEKIGYYAIFGLVDRLRKLDYASGDDQMTAWELNKLIEAIASGMNAGFVAVEAGGDLDPRKADHNARTNVAWDRLLTKFQSKADFDTWRKERQSKSK